jgi:Cytochrome P460
MKRVAAGIGIGLFVLFATAGNGADDDLGIAAYTDRGQLTLPDDLEQWIYVGTSLGGDYNEQAFTTESAGPFGVVQMEPNAYRYFVENGEYADGTMFLLTFYAAESKSEPQLSGFIQGQQRAQEIHVIDTARFGEGSAFFVFQTREQRVSERMPEGSACIQCHSAEGDYRSTFIQFYPVIREVERQ